MEIWQGGLVVLGVLGVLFIRAYQNVMIRRAEIEEQGKNQRTIANAEARQNLRKMDGVFEISLAKLAEGVGVEGDDFGSLLRVFSVLKEGKNASSVSPPARLSWEVLRDQLQNPDVKALVLAHRDEVLEILRS